MDVVGAIRGEGRHQAAPLAALPARGLTRLSCSVDAVSGVREKDVTGLRLWRHRLTEVRPGLLRSRSVFSTGHPPMVDVRLAAVRFPFGATQASTGLVRAFLAMAMAANARFVAMRLDEFAMRSDRPRRGNQQQKREQE